MVCYGVLGCVWRCVKVCSGESSSRVAQWLCFSYMTVPDKRSLAAACLVCSSEEDCASFWNHTPGKSGNTDMIDYSRTSQ